MLTLSTVTGILKGYDQLMNLVLDEVKETMRGELSVPFSGLYLFDFNFYMLTSYHKDEEGNTTTRSMGLIVARGTLIVLISPADGSEEIPNPFLQAEE